MQLLLSSLSLSPNVILGEPFAFCHFEPSIICHSEPKAKNLLFTLFGASVCWDRLREESRQFANALCDVTNTPLKHKGKHCIFLQYPVDIGWIEVNQANKP